MRSTSVTGSANPARCSSAPTSRRSANGATRGDTPPSQFGFRRGKGLPQLGQRIAADHRRQQQPVGFQRTADLRQHAGQIVDELKCERGDGEIERFRPQRQRLGFDIRQIDARHVTDAIPASALRT